MSASPSSFNRVADEQAALWAARLDGSTLSAAARDEFDRWLKADPQHRVLLSNYCQLSADLEQQLPQLGDRLDLQLQTPPRRRKSTHALWATLALAAAAAVAVLVAPRSPSDQLASIATAVGQRHELTLGDGSRVEMNAQTNLAVSLTAGHRHIRLGSGQAFFAVAKDADRPFIVETPFGAVRVTGTQFDVRADGSGPFVVTVVEGSVQVRANDNDSAPVALVAGQRYVAGRPATVETVNPDALSSLLAWRQGQVVFDGVPLREALAQFARYHGRSLVASESVAHLPIGGRYSLDDVDGFLSALEDLFPVQVSRTLSGAVHVRTREEP